MLKIASWNVNSIKVRLPHVLQYCREEQPDVLLFQEIKCVDEAFPAEALSDLGYNLAVQGQKAYNGVAIASKRPLDDISRIDLTVGDLGEARYIEALIPVKDGAIRVASIYVPNGSEIRSPKYQDKLTYLAKLHQLLLERQSSDEAFFIGGDFNVAPYEIDVYDPKALANSVGFHQDERGAMVRILSSGYTDGWRHLYPEERAYSWWDYRDRNSLSSDRGMRIDYILGNGRATKMVRDAGIAREYRALERPSDHVPVWVSLAEAG